MLGNYQSFGVESAALLLLQEVMLTRHSTCRKITGHPTCTVRILKNDAVLRKRRCRKFYISLLPVFTYLERIVSLKESGLTVKW